MPKISIIVPVYNMERYLRRCLDSIVAQSMKDIEIICVDDGSTDSSGEIIDQYAAEDGRMKALHKLNQGYGAAFLRFRPLGSRGAEKGNGSVHTEPWGRAEYGYRRCGYYPL